VLDRQVNERVQPDTKGRSGVSCPIGCREPKSASGFDLYGLPSLIELWQSHPTQITNSRFSRSAQGMP